MFDDAEEVHWLYPLYVVSAAGDASVPYGFDSCIADAVESFRTQLNSRPHIAESIYVSRMVHACGLWADRPLLATTVATPPGPVQDRVGSSYSGLFQLLAETLTADARRITAGGRRCFVPVVIVVIGSPIGADDAWATALERLVFSAEEMSASARAIVVPIALTGAHMTSAAAQMAMPATTSKSYEVTSLERLSDVLRSVLLHAATQLVESNGANLLPTYDELLGSGHASSNREPM